MCITPSVLRCCWLGLLTCKTHYRVGEPTAAWQFVDIRQHRSFDNGGQYVSCEQRQPPLSGAPVDKMAVNHHEGETDPSGFRVWWISSSLWGIFVPPYRQCLTGSSLQQQQAMCMVTFMHMKLLIYIPLNSLSVSTLGNIIWVSYRSLNRSFSRSRKSWRMTRKMCSHSSLETFSKSTTKPILSDHKLPV